MTMELPLNKSREGLGAAIGSNLAGGATAFNDTRAIDQILGQVAQSGNPQDMTNVMQSILARVSPDRQKEAMQLLKSRQEAVVNKQTQNEMVNMADRIEETNPDSPQHKMLSDVLRSNIPQDQKEKLIKTISATNPFKVEQAKRLKQDSTIRNYNSLIKETQKKLANLMDSGGDEKEIKSLKQRRDKLEKERDKILNFDALKEKSTFDPNNPEHMKKFEEIEAQFKGNKVKINEAMGEEFNL